MSSEEGNAIARHAEDGNGPELGEVGRWETLSAEFGCAATHVALLPNHKIFAYGGSSLDPDEFKEPTLPPGELLDLQADPIDTCELSREGLAGDLWCGGHTLLEDGKLLFAGGTGFYPPPPDPFYGGLRQAYLFDPFDGETGSWERLPDMQEGRWYPTLIRLADNSVLVISGLRYIDPSHVPESSLLKSLIRLILGTEERIVNLQEVYDPETRSWGVMEAQRKFPLYPRLHLLPDGDVFYSGVFNTHYFVPGRFPSARWSYQSRAWVEVGGPHKHKSREEGLSVLLALRPPDYRSRVLIAGGGNHNLGRALMSLLHAVGRESWGNKFSFLTKVQDSVEMIDLGEPSPAWKAMPSMHYPRIHANGVLLPDGNLLVVGGMSKYGHREGTQEPAHAVRHAELYDPDANRWTVLAAQEKDRVYHSTALLLPDGRVISMGSNPQAKMIEESIEIFSPPYLHRGDRPAALEVPSGLAYGETFEVRVNNARRIAQVVLMRPDVLTHVTNTDQRLLELEFGVRGDEKLEVQGPLGREHMPQGYCMLFLLDQDGVPSEGEFVRVV